MFIPALCALALSGKSASQRPSRPPILIGWHDEFSRLRDWRALDMDNRARAELISSHSLRLSLGPTPPKWPYAYQWSGLKRDVTADVARYPVVMAFVGHIHGYAHLDIDVLDAEGHPVKTMRSSTLNIDAIPRPACAGFPGPASRPVEIESGVVVADLSKELLPATYSLEVRLIVGGPNAGCYAMYHWLRFVAEKDARWLAEFPGARVCTGAG